MRILNIISLASQAPSSSVQWRKDLDWVPSHICVPLSSCVWAGGEWPSGAPPACLSFPLLVFPSGSLSSFFHLLVLLTEMLPAPHTLSFQSGLPWWLHPTGLPGPAASPEPDVVLGVSLLSLSSHNPSPHGKRSRCFTSKPSSLQNREFFETSTCVCLKDFCLSSLKVFCSSSILKSSCFKKFRWKWT